MALGIVQFRPIAVIFIINCWIGSSLSLHVEITPEIVNELISDHASITCLANDSPFWTKKVMIISIGKSGQAPTATLAQSGGEHIEYGADRKPNFVAEGLIDSNASNSYLRLTIKKPGLQDAGEYSCRMYYLDGLGQLKEGKATAKLSVDNDNNKAVLIYLLKRVSDLEKDAREKNKKVEDQEAKKSDAAFKNLLKKVSALGKMSSQQNLKLKDHDNTLKQQRKKIDDQGKRLKELEKSVNVIKIVESSPKEKASEEVNEHAKDYSKEDNIMSVECDKYYTNPFLCDKELKMELKDHNPWPGPRPEPNPFEKL